jgi:hypothetical protein
MIEGDDETGGGQDEVQGEARAAPELEDAVMGLEREQRDAPAIALHVRAPAGHDSSGEKAEKTRRFFEGA